MDMRSRILKCNSGKKLIYYLNLTYILKKYKILSMITNPFQIKTPQEITTSLAAKVKQRRKEAKLTQKQLSEKSGVSLGSVKRFETSGEISLHSLVKLAIALGCEEDFTPLFAKKQYHSIQEIIDEEI